MSSTTPTFYIFHGRDEFTLGQTLADLRRRLASAEVADLNTTWLDGRSVTLAELRQACETVPFLAERRLVIVTGLLTRLQGEGRGNLLTGLLRLLPDLPETTRLVFVEEETLPENHPVLALAMQHERGFVRRFDPPDIGALPGWIVRCAQRHGGRIARDAATHLAQAVGSDLRLLDQEVQKLVTYAGEGEEISLEQVLRLVPYTRQAVIFDLVDALGQRKGRVATETLQRLLDSGEHPLGILKMIVRQFRLLIQTQELRESGENAASIAQILRLHPFPARKLYDQAVNFRSEQLEQIYRYLLETDARVKEGEMSAELALELLVAGLTASAR
jgi:DNA polymerase-3 subunit delta